MLIKNISTIKPFTASDGSLIKEIIHPENDGTAKDVSLALAEVMPGKATRTHKLSFVEIYYILSGTGLMHIDSETEQVRSGQAVYIPANSRQYIENTGSEVLSFLCVCAPAYDAQKDINI